MKQVLSKIIIFFLSPILFFGIMEICFRQFGGDSVKNYYDQQTEIALGKPVPIKRAREYRGFIFGGSSAYGFPVTDRSSVSAWLNRGFEKLLPGFKVTVVNAAWPGKASHQDLEGSYTVAKYKPDFFIVYTGHNEANIANRIYSDSWIYRLNLKLYYRSAFYHWLISRAEKIEKFVKRGKRDKQYREEIIAQKIYGEAAVSESEYNEISRRFEANIHSIIKIAQKIRIPVVLVSPASNLHDISPHMSIHSNELNESSLRNWQGLLDKAQNDISGNKYQEAMDAFRQAIKVDPEYAKTHLELAKIEERLGEIDEAKREFVLARDLDRKPSRAKSQLINILKKFETSRNVLFVDLEGIYSEQSPNGIIGYDFIYDDVHPTVKGQQIIAEAILRKLAEIDWIKPRSDCKWDEYELLKKSELWKVDASHEAYHDILTGLLLWQQKDYQGASVSFERGIAAMPGFIEAYAFLGDSYYRINQQEKAWQAFKTLEAKDFVLEKNLLQKYPDLDESYSGLRENSGF